MLEPSCMNVATVKFFTPDVAFSDAPLYLPALLTKGGVKGDAASKLLSILEIIVRSIDAELYEGVQRNKEAALVRFVIAPALPDNIVDSYS